MSEVVNLFANYETQNLLLQAAAKAIPHSFDKCTFPLGYLRQQVHLCITCNEVRGLCGACSVSCHPDHQQIELFPKREFRCDCPTRALAHPCSLNGAPTATGDAKSPINEFNKYNQNYRDGGRFCRCHSLYDAEKERETMVQCLACEDWYHESCLNLRERIPPLENPEPATDATEEPEEDGSSGPPESSTESENAENQKFWDYEDEDEEEDPSIPKALIPAKEYDSFICGECLINSPMLLKWAGSSGARMVVRNGSEGEWYIHPTPPQEPSTSDGSQASTAENSKKRNRDEMEEVTMSESEPPTKRVKHDTEPADTEVDSTTKVNGLTDAPPKIDSSTCTAPKPDPPIQALLDQIIQRRGPYMEGPGLQGTGDIFLTTGWRERWCKCNDCSLYLAAKPYLAEEEETYELPEDPDAGLSLEELGMRALEKLPRDVALDGIRAFQTMSAELSAFLAPFAQSGKVVREQDVLDFFAARQQQRKK